MMRLKIGLAVAALVMIAGGGWIWLRDSSLVRVQDVEISGVTASDGDQVRSALTESAQSMSTLHVHQDALRAAVARFTSVGDLEVDAHFPHRLTIHVIERRAVAALAQPGASRLPVTANGVVLRGITAGRDLPSVLVDHQPAGTRVTDTSLLHALAVASQAPEPLLAKTEQLQVDDRGVVAAMHNGPDLVFGSDEAAHAKWLAAARVLAEPSAQGATYLDLRIPGRVAAGGLAPVATPTVDPNPLLEPQTDPTLDP
jgi:cell division protein FtsQ